MWHKTLTFLLPAYFKIKVTWCRSWEMRAIFGKRPESVWYWSHMHHSILQPAQWAAQWAAVLIAGTRSCFNKLLRIKNWQEELIKYLRLSLSSCRTTLLSLFLSLSVKFFLSHLKFLFSFSLAFSPSLSFSVVHQIRSNLWAMHVFVLVCVPCVTRTWSCRP